ncbi:MAG: hypothetical protein AAGF11_33065 [Myxococcota bacterium]
MLLGSGACGTPVEGELRIETHEGRTIQYSPRQCADGDHFGYFGVELRDEDDRILEFFRDGDDPQLAFYAPGDAAFELGPDDCEQLAGELHRDSVVGSDSGTVRGHLEVDCEAPNGSKIQGSVSFEQCGAPEVDKDCDDDG